MVQARGSAMTMSRLNTAQLKYRSEIGRALLRLGDFPNAPVVDQFDLSVSTGKSGESKRIAAHDDFQVSGVAVAIHDTNGTVLEQGAATAADGVWNYAVTTNLPAGQRCQFKSRPPTALGQAPWLKKSVQARWL